jgi:serine protease AprX
MVNLVNLRVLDKNGSGYTSNVINAIQWAIANRNAIGPNGKPLNIRVLNLSLGHAPYESAATDPLTIACRKAVAAGIVVVVSAGNYGKDDNGNPVFGGITSPGTEPSVITVGAMTTWDTITRADDTLATYSSRGPTIDGLIKPDIVAPGSRIVSDLSPLDTLVVQNPQIAVNSYYMKLSGTSMAAPFVSGAAALILNKNPNLSPNAVKAILMYTAERINKDPLEVGAGYLNVLGALNLASNINANTSTGQYWLLNSGAGLSYVDKSLSGNTIVWGDTIVWDETFFSGTSLYYNLLAWGNTIVWGDTIVWDETIVWSDTIIWKSDISALSSIIAGQTIVWDELSPKVNGYSTLVDGDQ